MKRGGVGRGDPQYGILLPIPPVANVHTLRDGATLPIGEIAITAHFTPGHTPGGTSWTWKSCEKDVCHEIVYADSVTPVSAEGFKFIASREYPNALKDFQKSFAFLDAVPCDILIATHPEASELWDRLAERERGLSPDPMIDPKACHELADRAREQLRQRVEEEKTSKAGKAN